LIRSWVERSYGQWLSVRRALADLVTCLSAMPWILRICSLALPAVGVVMLTTPFVPFGTVQIMDERFPATELWSRGYGPSFLVVGLVTLAGGVGLLRRRGWARWFVVFLYPLFAPLAFVYLHRHPDTRLFELLQMLLPGIIWGVFFYWYLFRRHAKRFS
jgi:hypothetical protein